MNYHLNYMKKLISSHTKQKSNEAMIIKNMRGAHEYFCNKNDFKVTKNILF